MYSDYYLINYKTKQELEFLKKFGKHPSAVNSPEGATPIFNEYDNIVFWSDGEIHFIEWENEPAMIINKKVYVVSRSIAKDIISILVDTHGFEDIPKVLRFEDDGFAFIELINYLIKQEVLP